MSESSSSAKQVVTARTNWVAAIVLVVLALIGVGVLYALNVAQERRLRREALATAERLDKEGQTEIALRHLGQYLTFHPDDAEGLELRTRLLEKVATSPSQVLEVAKAYDQLLRLQPAGPYAQKARRRLVEQYIRFGDLIKQSADFFEALPGLSALESRYQAAETHARELLRRGADDAEAHRLMAMALDGLAVPANPDALNASIREYRRALEIDPKDLEAADRLSQLYRTKLKDNARAERVLDDLLRASPNSIDVRLLRHRFYNSLNQADKGAAELEAATKIAPDDVRVLLSAAEDALRRGNVPGAREKLDRIPEKFRNDPRVLMVKGQADFSDELPDEAVDAWRKGLLSTSGTDAELTWWLAYAMLQLGRISDARPLMTQYRRLAGDSAVFGILVGLLYEKAGRPARAVTILEGLPDKIGERWQLLIELTRGRCYEALWDEMKATLAYRAALKIDDTSVVPRLALAKLLLRRRPAEAVSELEIGLSKTPFDPALRVALAGALLQVEATKPPDRRSWAEFDAAFKRAVESSPRSSTVALLQADRLNLEGRGEEALKFLQEAAESTPRSAPLALALADALTRRDKLPLALEVLEKAAKPEAAGDQASLRIARSRLLTALNRGREARSLLVTNIEQLPMSERHLIWVALGRLESEQGNTQAARLAYERWSTMIPEDPRPRLLVIELALTQNDEPGARKALEELGQACETTDIAYRLARVRFLLWERDAANPAPGSRDESLEEAARLVTSVLDDAPQVPAAQMFRAMILERQNRIDDAIAAYERLWERGHEEALPRVVELLTRRRRFDELIRLKGGSAVASTQVDLLSSQAFLRAGEQTQALRMTEQVSRDAGGSPQALGWQARMLDVLGRFDDAEASLRAMAERQVTNPEAWLLLVNYQATHQRKAVALETIARAKSLVKTDRPDLFNVRCLWALGETEKADAAFDEILKAKPNDVETLVQQSRYFEETKRQGRAEETLSRILELDPKNRPAARQYAVLLSARRSDVKLWERAYTLIGNPSPADEPDDRLARALVMSRAPDPTRRARAMDDLEALVADLATSHPTAAKARELLAKLLMEDGQAERASQFAAVSANSGDPTSIALYAQALLQSKNPEAAEWQVNRLAALNPGDPREARLRAQAIWDRSRPVEAASALFNAYSAREGAPGAEVLGREVFGLLSQRGEEAENVAERLGRRIAQKDPGASWMPASVLARRGRYDEALTMLRAVMRPGTKSEDILEAGKVAMAVAVGATGDSETIRRVGLILDDAVRLAPGAEDLLVFTAMLRHLQGDFEGEVQIFRKVLERQPENAVALNNIAWALSEGLNRPQEALKYAEDLIRYAGRDPEALDTRGGILVRLGRCEEAVKDLEEAVKAAPNGLRHFHLARAYKCIGRVDDARRNRDLAKAAGLTVERVERTEREDFNALSSL